MNSLPPRPPRRRPRPRLLHAAPVIILTIAMISCSPLRPHPAFRVAAKAAAPVKGKVFLVPGFFDNRHTMRPLRKALEAGGYECVTISLQQPDARHGIQTLANQLRECIDRECARDETFSLVAFSMGGLVSRYYLQKLGGATRCRGLYTIATPHHGTLIAYLYPGRGTRQMRPESAFLQSLRATEESLAHLPVTSYRSPLDVVMLPTRSPKWLRAENVRIWAPIHPALLWEKQLHADLLKRLGENAN